ncbi:hypothetical protein GJAV_G00063380 [Gymnothorax javanicus]|nr:hypothetical protein GJAV_G00063380 [Gymnothorax javanicus]
MPPMGLDPFSSWKRPRPSRCLAEREWEPVSGELGVDTGYRSVPGSWSSTSSPDQDFLCQHIRSATGPLHGTLREIP